LLDLRFSRLRSHNRRSWLSRHLWLPLALVLSKTILEGVLICLLIVWLIDPAFRVHTVRKHVLTIDIATYGRVGVTHTISMEGRLAEIGCEG
jgi:hypothetical protein